MITTQISKREEKTMECVGVTINPKRFEVMVNGKEIELTFTQFKILQTLIEANGDVKTRKELMLSFRDEYFESGMRTIDTHIKTIRTKLEPYQDRIKVIRKVGYCFR
jgi:DNA-binding response OmpR family regulator